MADASLSIEIPSPHGESLRELLKEFPTLRLVERGGWMVKKYTVEGSSEAIDAARPKLAAWEHDCASRDAW